MMTFAGFPNIQNLSGVPPNPRFYKKVLDGQKKFTCHTNRRYQYRVTKKNMKTKDMCHYQRN